MKRSWLALLLLLGLALAWLGTRSPERASKVTVFAASSLTEGFESLAARFEAEYPGVDVELVFSGSQVLRMQLQAGARADVMASAHPEHLKALARSGHAHPAQNLVRNRLAVIVQSDHPTLGWQDLHRVDSWILGSADVPIGRYTERLFESLEAFLGQAQVQAMRAKVRSQEPNVRMVRAKLAMKQAQGAVVYASDLRSDLPIKEVPLPAHLQQKVRVQIAQLKRAGSPQLAEQFIEFARSPQGQQILVAHGFLAREGQ